MSYSPFHKISRHSPGDEIITVKNAETVLIKGIKYRRALSYGFRCGELDHYIISQAPCNKLYVSRNWYIEVRPHKCEFNCIDSEQSDQEWIDYLRSPDADKRIVQNILRFMEKFGYHNGPPNKGDKRIG